MPILSQKLVPKEDDEFIHLINILENLVFTDLSLFRLEPFFFRILICNKQDPHIHNATYHQSHNFLSIKTLI
jgi:hypothetical protein